MDIFALFNFTVSIFVLFILYRLSTRENELEEREKNLLLKETQMFGLTLKDINSIYWNNNDLCLDEKGTCLLKEGTVLVDLQFNDKDVEPTEFHAVLIYYKNRYWLYEYEKFTSEDEYSALCLYPAMQCKFNTIEFKRPNFPFTT